MPIEDVAVRGSLIEAMQAAGVASAALQILSGAPVLLAICDASGGQEGRQAAWMSAAQLAIAAEAGGLGALVVPAPEGRRVGAALALFDGCSVEALVALGLPADEPRGPDARRIGANPPPVGGTETGLRQILLSFMEIASATAAAEDLDGVLETIARALGRLFPVDGAALGLVEDGGVIVREVLGQATRERRDPVRLPADGLHLLAWVIARGKPLWRNDIEAELRFAESLPGGGMLSDMVIPLQARGRVIGAFRVACRRKHAFDFEDFEVMQRCADLMAVAVETQRLLLATKRMAEVDGVTGVFNHRHFLGLVDQEVTRSQRTGRPVALLMIDIDNFKRFNDTYGHQAGDEVLRHVAQIAARTLRRSDAVARYGGEEFAAILQDSDSAGGMTVAEKIRGEVERSPLVLPEMPRPLRVSVSIGVASCPAEAGTATELVAAADRGLYRAKRSGKNRVCRPAGLTPDDGQVAGSGG